MKRRRKEKVCSFDLEKWLRQMINGATGFKLGESRTIRNPAGNIIGSYGEGGRVEHFTGAEIGGMESVARFSLYPGVSMETLTQHHWKQAVIAHIMLGIEAEHGNPRQLRPEKILGVAFTHDLSEILCSDVNYHVKNKDQKSKVAHKRKDLAMHHRALKDLRPEWRAYFPAPPDVNDEFPETERKFWEACELAGYCLFMLEEIALGNICDQHIVHFYDDVNGYVVRLIAMGNELESVSEMLSSEILPKLVCVAFAVADAKKRLLPAP